MRRRGRLAALLLGARAARPRSQVVDRPALEFDPDSLAAAGVSWFNPARAMWTAS